MNTEQHNEYWTSLTTVPQDDAPTTTIPYNNIMPYNITIPHFIMSPYAGV